MGLSGLRTEDRNTLSAYFRARQSKPGPDGTVPLAELLAAFGLPAQTVGAGTASAGADRPALLLSPEDLAACAKTLVRVRREFERRRGTRAGGVFEAFERACPMLKPGDVAVRPQDFLAAVQAELGADACRTLGLEAQLGQLVAYLTEEVPNQISLRKLSLALSYSESDPPLQQHGVEELKGYQAALRAELSRASGSAADVAELAAWLAR